MTSGVDDPAAFYTGLVAELYAPLRGSTPDADIYDRFIRAAGEPALELACGGGDPLLELRRRGIDVEGLDSSVDMLDRARAAARRLGLEIVVYQGDMRDFDIGCTYRSIFLAGPSFNLVPSDADAVRALRRIRAHLDPAGRALVPLFVPPPVDPTTIGRATEAELEGGDHISCTVVAVERDEHGRTQITRLRYVRDGPRGHAETERDWLLHWFSPPRFAELASEAGLTVNRCTEWDGSPATDASTGFAAVLGHSAEEPGTRPDTVAS
jgi:SAM-dependent methyltransferase